MSFVVLFSSINSPYHIFGDFNIHVHVPDGDVYKFMTFLDSCDLKQLVNEPTHLHGHTLDLNLSPSDQDTIVDVKICDFVSDHALVKCSIALPHQAAHIPNKVQYRSTTISTCPISFVKSPANAVVDLEGMFSTSMHH